jgi:hypothetical protein
VLRFELRIFPSERRAASAIKGGSTATAVRSRRWCGIMTRLRQAFLALALLVLPMALLRTALGAGPQTAKPMPDLTVPATRLAPGCLLAPQSHFEPVVVSQSGGVRVTRVDPNVTASLPPAHPVNPWVGSDVQSVGWLRSRMSFRGIHARVRVRPGHHRSSASPEPSAGAGWPDTGAPA